jgi:ABC-type polysaccharide/polyol phosphate export permease
MLHPGPQSAGDDWIVACPSSLRAAAARAAAGPSLLWARRDLLLTCLGRELRARFQGSVLGWVWPLLQPLALFAVYGFLFTQLLGLRLPGAGGAAYGVYLLSGALVWSGFAEGLTRATTSVVDGRNLVQKLAFPAEVLPAVPVLAALVSQAFGVAVFVASGAATGVAPWPGAALAWLPALVLAQLCLTHGAGLACAALHVGLRDTAPLLTMLLTVLMFVTPVFWLPSAAALPALERWLPLVEANPLHHLLAAWRGVLLAGRPEELFHTPVAPHVLALLPWALGAYALGRLAFARNEERFADEV